MPMRIGTEMPSLDGATEWFGATQAHAENEAKGQPTLVYFWAVSCGICKDNMARVAEWRDQKRAEGLRVIAVHMPRYEADTNVEDVREAISQIQHHGALRDRQPASPARSFQERSGLRACVLSFRR